LSAIERRIDLDSADFSSLSFEALNALLLNSSVNIDSEDSLLRVILNLPLQSRFLLRHIQLPFLSFEGLSLLAKHFNTSPESFWEWTAEVIARTPLSPSPLLSSLIISSFPIIFAEFRRKTFKLLWRGSRDGFGAQAFHDRCDGHANTLAIILDTNGNIFGGFTPVEWESRTPRARPPMGRGMMMMQWGLRKLKCCKPDDSLQRFLFILKNPHSVTARRFLLEAEEKHRAI
jgi:hypothetical protein